MKIILRIIIVLLLTGGVTYGGWWYWQKHSTTAPTYRIATVKRGDLLAAISATGTVEPEEVIDVGAQVAGQILNFGKDPVNREKFVDYGTQVDEGTVLAQIDTSLYQFDVAQAQAAYDQSVASVARAKADLEQMQAKLRQAQRDWDRAQKLGPSDALSQTDYDTYQGTFESAKATVGVGQASLVQSEKSVEQTDAALKKSKRNLSYCTISSPVKGVIIDRRVNTGQTVVSSLNAPSLFLIAKDLTRMQVWASVNEADIGNIYSGQHVTFTVDAYPFRTFKGDVGKVRYNATMTQNVVTYTVEIVTDNSDKALLPYLTANVQFILHDRHNVLTVPNTALRYTPRLEQVAPEARESVAKQLERRAGGGGQRGASAQGGNEPTTVPTDKIAKAGASHSRGLLWVQDGQGFLKPIKVQTGVTDGVATEVQADELKDNEEIVVGEIQAANAAPEGTNPFAPQMPARGGARGGR